ncbi:MAG: AI-2E family transporter [Lachnospiraceae bacterium]|nr:AI-2E family transporter [Lachnospiraceae bacterium]
MSKETIKALRGLMIFAAVLVLAVLHLDKVIMFIGLVIGILRPFLIGAAVAFIINIPMKAIEGRLFARKNRLSRWKRPLSFLLSILAVVVVFWAVWMLIIPQLGDTVSELAIKIPAFFRETLKILQEVFDNNAGIQEYIAELNIANWDWNGIIAKIADALGSGIGNVLVSTVSVAGSIFGVVFDGVIAFVFAIYVLMQKETLSGQFERLMQAYLPEKLCLRIRKVLRLLNKNFNSFFSSQCLEAVILGALFVVAMSIFGFPYAVLIGTLIAVTALVPIVGAFIGCAVGAFLILVEDPLLAVGFVIMFLILQQLEGNLIYPRVVGSSVGLPAIWVLVAVSVGGSLFGVVGMLIFIPITSTLYTLLREDVNERNAKKARLTAKAKAENKQQRK